MSFLPLLTAIVGLVVTLVAVPPILRACLKSRLLVRSADLHHTHQAPTPRLGGLVLVLAFLAVEAFIAIAAPGERDRTPGRTGVLISSLAMFALGFWDDIRPLGARNKLIGQVLIAASVLLSGIGIQQFKIPFTEHIVNLGPWGAVLTLVWLISMTNLINLVDGVDGLAGGICLMLMVLIAFVGHQNGNFELLASGMAGALLGFLWYNFPPARVYLGDGGAYFLGFQIGLFSIINSHKGTVFVALIAPLFVLALPIVDTILAILRRWSRGLPVFRPDRRHIHHHLISMGVSRRRIVLWIYAVTLVFLFMGLLAYWSRGHLVPVLLGISGVLLLGLAGKFKFSREWFAVGRVLGNSIGMRNQVRYALSLVQWLELEGEREASLETLFADFSFAARKLGFCSVETVCGGVPLKWRDERESSLPPGAREAVCQVRVGVDATIRLSGIVCCKPDHPCVRALNSACSGFCDERRFEITSELLAEGWIKAHGAFEKHRKNLVPASATAVGSTARIWDPASIPVPGKLQRGES